MASRESIDRPRNGCPKCPPRQVRALGRPRPGCGAGACRTAPVGAPARRPRGDRRGRPPARGAERPAGDAVVGAGPDRGRKRRDRPRPRGDRALRRGLRRQPPRRGTRRPACSPTLGLWGEARDHALLPAGRARAGLLRAQPRHRGAPSRRGRRGARAPRTRAGAPPALGLDVAVAGGAGRLRARARYSPIASSPAPAMAAAPPAEQGAYCYALGKAHADRGEHALAFAAFARGAAQLKSALPLPPRARPHGRDAGTRRLPCRGDRRAGPAAERADRPGDLRDRPAALGHHAGRADPHQPQRRLRRGGEIDLASGLFAKDLGDVSFRPCGATSPKPACRPPRACGATGSTNAFPRPGGWSTRRSTPAGWPASPRRCCPARR